MKKKISVLVCVIMATLCFTGCSAKKNEVEYDVATMQETVDVIVSSFASMADEDFEQYMDLSEYQLNYVMMNSGLRIEAESFLAMIKSWQAGEDECGAYVSHGDYKVDEKGGEVVISTEAEYESRKATLSFTFSKDSYLESMDVSASYSLNEILAKAGLNTVLGMGTVFAVLIFLAFLISMMKYISVIMKAFLILRKMLREMFEEISSYRGKARIMMFFVKTIVLIAKCCGMIFSSVKNEKKVKTTEETIIEATLKTTANTEVDDELELVAVITAAIAAQEGTTTDGFVVRSIRRRPTNNWK